MSTFTVGEEVRFDGRRYVVSQIDPSFVKAYRLLRTTPRGMDFQWVDAAQLEKMKAYTTPVDDTSDR